MNDLSVIPAGWTPRGWLWNINRLAACCINETRAAELRVAAESIEQRIGPPRICFICSLELDGLGNGQPFDRGWLIEDDAGDEQLVCKICHFQRTIAPNRRRATA